MKASEDMEGQTVLTISVDALPRMGGISTMTHHLANAVAGTGARSIVLAPGGSHTPMGFERHYELCEDWESDIAARDGPRGALEDARIERLITALIEAHRPARLLLMHGFYYGSGAVRAARAAGVPVSVFVHGTELTSQLACTAMALSARRDPMSLGARLLVVLGDADEVLANSTFTAGLVRRYAPAARVRVTGVGLTRARLTAESRNTPTNCSRQQAARRRALGFSTGPVISYIGRLAPHKRIDRVLRIAARVPNATCLIGGAGPAGDALKELAQGLGLGRRAHFTGPLGEAEKWRFLRASDFACLMSEYDKTTGAYEGFGIGLLEAAAAGAVPLSTGADGMAEFMAGTPAPGLTFSATPFEPADAASRILSLWHDEARFQTLITQGRRAIAETFNWEAIAARILAHDTALDRTDEVILRHAG